MMRDIREATYEAERVAARLQPVPSGNSIEGFSDLLHGKPTETKHPPELLPTATGRSCSTRLKANRRAT